MGVFKNGVGRPSNETIKKRNIFKAICLVLVLIIIVLAAYMVNDKLKENKNNNIDNKKNNTKEVSNGWYEPTGTAKELDLYKITGEYWNDIVTNKETINNSDTGSSKKVGTYKCNNNNCKLFSASNESEKLVLIKDEDYIIYNYKTNKAKKVDFGKYTGKVNYIDDIDINDSGLGALYIGVQDAGKETYFKIVIANDGPETLFGLIDGEGNIIVMLKDDELNKDELWNSSEMSNVVYFDDGSVYYIDGNRYVKYDPTTKKLEKSRYYHSTVLIDDKGYIVVVDNDNYLKVLNLKGKVLSKLTKIDDSMKIHSMLSGWFEQDKKAGIYIVVENPRVTCEDLSENMKEEAGCNSEYGSESLGYEYYYIPKTGETGKIATFIGGYAKPILYLYPTSDNTSVNVSFAKPELLTTTYPKYKNNWSVVANKNGNLKDENGKYYYGLYWEESGYINVDFKEGFYVTKDNAINFLEEKLSIIGLNYKERNEFIMYWLPILEKNKKSLVYFELTNSRQNYNRLIINPKPDSLLRVAIHVKKVNQKTSIKEEKLPSFERKGFTAVEWGGVIHK